MLTFDVQYKSSRHRQLENPKFTQLNDALYRYLTVEALFLDNLAIEKCMKRVFPPSVKCIGYITI